LLLSRSRLDGLAAALGAAIISLSIGWLATALRGGVKFPIAETLRPIHSARDVAEAQSDLVEAVSFGNITPAEAAEISKVLANAAKAYEIADTENDEDLIRQLSDAELYRIIAREQAVEIIGPRLPTIASR
jgi:hypothetical protein